MPFRNHWEMPPLHFIRASVARALDVALPTSAGVVRSVRNEMATGSNSECWQNCTSPCPNTTAPCLCPCDQSLHSNPSLEAAFASISFLFFLVATIQLILCMAHDALPSRQNTNTNRAVAQDERWRKAFRLTVQKSLLGAVIGATGTRAIYYTVQGYIEEKWAEILLHVYYPALLSAFSLLILFWAEIFYQSTAPSENHMFLKKHKYSLTFLCFNGLVYLLLLAEVVATPLVHDDTEQVRKNGIIGIIFAVLLFLMLVGFLHLAIRLFFRPDWQPLVLQLEALKINLKQHTLSCLGIVTNALMQALIISLLVFNMVSRLKPVDDYSQYVASLVIRVTELVMPVWFCCSLWNYKKPTSLWILNPGLLIQQLDLRGTEQERLVRTRDTENPSTYGSIERSQASQLEEGYCWVCHDRSPTTDLIQPCRCLLHRQCIQRWVEHRVLNPEVPQKEALKCQVCREKYHTKNRRFTCIPKGLSKRHWVKVVGLLAFFVLTGLASVYVLVYAHVSSGVKVATVVILVFADAALLKYVC
ncbi:hypothetical protein GBAR_LOCUS21192 [Geodia barretti]|uniref:RING-CH-type domain-containing protein n=1 Tax=Geodia barretti TaxID=519541 RepID=A0AA35SXJ8_GEOBA|nr:hypothetical protein GBAR_LOCUS21192 [Geodia barretti]